MSTRGQRRKRQRQIRVEKLKALGLHIDPELTRMHANFRNDASGKTAKSGVAIAVGGAVIGASPSKPRLGHARTAGPVRS